MEIQDKIKINQKMWHIALPAIIANISIPLLGIADSYLMGHMSDSRYLTAVAIGSMVFSLLFGSLNFLRMATTGLTAQNYGRGDHKEVNLLFLRAGFIALTIGILLIIFQTPLSLIVTSLTHSPPETESLAVQYFNIRIWSAPFTLLNFVAVGWLLGLGKAKEVLYIQVFLNLLNISLNFLFVRHFNMTVEGVALGTLCSEFITIFLSFYFIHTHSQKYLKHPLWNKDYQKIFWQKSAFKKLFQLNRDIFIRTLCLTGCLAYFVHLGGRLGDQIIAANAILMQLQIVTSYTLDGFAQAAEVLTGKEIGRRSLKKLRYSILVSSKWALICAGLLTVIFALFENGLIHGLTNIASLRDITHEYYIWVIILPLISVWSFQLDGIFIGATRGAEMRNGMILSTLLFILISHYAVETWHNHGLWFSYCAFISLRGLTLFFYYPKIEKQLKQ